MAFKWLARLFGRDTSQADAGQMALQALPVLINPDQRQQLARHAGRLANLLRAVERGAQSAEIARELVYRKFALQAAGIAVPETATAAHALRQQIEEGR